ncbi:MAG: TetR/AcrR family transcriptional regulator [Actinobacteria bacterium]|nr:TetR/AcrR family transcriptional regulator [Actinomycetota bacterium]
MEATENRVNVKRAENITQAAYQSIVEHGFCEATTQMIARRAGVSKSMIHYYFADKNSLVTEVARMVMERLMETIREVMDRYPTREEKIDKGITDLWEAFTKEQGMWIVVYENAINGRRIPEIRANLVDFYRELLSRIAETIFPPEEVGEEVSARDAEAMAAIFSATIDSLLFHYLIDPEATDFAYALEMLKRLARALPL